MGEIGERGSGGRVILVVIEKWETNVILRWYFWWGRGLVRWLKVENRWKRIMCGLFYDIKGVWWWFRRGARLKINNQILFCYGIWLKLRVLGWFLKKGEVDKSAIDSLNNGVLCEIWGDLGVFGDSALLRLRWAFLRIKIIIFEVCLHFFEIKVVVIWHFLRLGFYRLRRGFSKIGEGFLFLGWHFLRFKLWSFLRSGNFFKIWVALFLDRVHF